MNAGCSMKTFFVLFISCLAYFSASARAGIFSLEIVEPALQLGDQGILRVLYDGGLKNYSFEQGGLDLRLNSTNPGIIKFLDAEILNEGRWEVTVANQIGDDTVGRLFAASLFTPGLAGAGPRTFAEIRYSLVGTGHTELLLEAGGEDPAVHGPLGDISHNVLTRGVCIGGCLPGTQPADINLGESWARLREQLYGPPVKQPQPTQPVWNEPIELFPHEPVTNSPNPVEAPPIQTQPSVPTATRPGVFSLEVVEPALQYGDKGRLRVMYDGGSEDYSFANGGIWLKLTSSNPGVISFSDAQVFNDDERWAFATARGLTADSIDELLAFSVLTPGMTGIGPQVFAEIEYSRLGSGFTDLVLDVQGDDPLVDGAFGDVSGNLLSRGACLGECLPGHQPVEINLGESWAHLREQMYPTVPYQPPVVPVPNDPVPNDPVPNDPVTENPLPTDPLGEEPAPNEPVPSDPVEIEIQNPIVYFPEIDYTAIKMDWLTFPVWSVIDIQEWKNSEFLIVENTELFSRNGSLRHLIDEISLAYTFGNGTVALGYDGNGTIAYNALSMMAAAAASMNSSPNLTVPEPTSLVLSTCSLICLMLRRRSCAR